MNNLTVLIAGTSNSYLEISRKMLKYHYENCEVDFAHSGQECIEKALGKKYELILFDYELSDKNGLEIIDALIGKDVGAPLIVLIEEGDEAKAVKAIDRGAADYILKTRGYLTALPFTIRNLLKKKNFSNKNRENKLRQNIKIQKSKPILQSSEFFILDKNCRILSANSEIQEMTRFTEDELLELNFTDLLPKEKEKTFFDWLHHLNSNGKTDNHFITEITNKNGDKVYLDIVLTPVRDENKDILSYKGRMSKSSQKIQIHKNNNPGINPSEFVRQITRVIITNYEESLGVFLERIAETVCQIFQFQRSTIALLDKRKKTFIKQTMVGYGSFPLSDGKNIEVSQEVIDRVFSDRYKVKVIYYNQEQRNAASYINSKFHERRTQKRRPALQWHNRDLVLINLTNRDDKTFGYISLDRPVPEFLPSHDTFRNLELLGQLISFAIENYYHISTIEQRSRRLKQILITSNIFKLHLSLNELLNEFVWSIRFSLNFNLVALGLISNNSGNLEVKAIACDDKIKRNQLLRLCFPLHGLSTLLKKDYNIGKSFFVNKKEEALRTFKNIYYGTGLNEKVNGHWPVWGVLIIPLKSKDGKIIGLLFADEPQNNQLPNKEVISNLEIMANQISVAIDNRVLYVKAKQKHEVQNKNEKLKEYTKEVISNYSSNRIKHRFVDRFFK